AVAWVSVGRRLMEPEEVAGGPADNFGLPSPLCQEAPTILDRLLPPTHRHEVGTSGLQGREGTTKTTFTTEVSPRCPFMGPLVVSVVFVVSLGTREDVEIFTHGGVPPWRTRPPLAFRPTA